MVELQTISIGLAALSFILAATYYIFNMRHARETRQAQLFMQLTSQLFTTEMMNNSIELLEMQWTDLEDFYRKYDSSVDRDNFVKRFQYWFLLNQVGYLLKKGLIDKDFTYTLLGGYSANWHWQKFKPIIEHQRVYQNMPELGIWFEYLVKEISKMNEQKGYSSKYRDDPGIHPDQL